MTLQSKVKISYVLKMKSELIKASAASLLISMPALFSSASRMHDGV